MNPGEKDLKQLEEDERTIKSLERKLIQLKDGSVEKMILDMQLNNKRENVKMRKMMYKMISQNQQLQNKYPKSGTRNAWLISKRQRFTNYQSR